MTELVGYKGQTGEDGGFFFCPYVYGKSEDLRVQPSYQPPTEIQQRIMEVVRHGNR